MGLQAITSRGLARGHKEGCKVRPHPAQGHGLCLQPAGAFLSLISHTHPYTHSPGGQQWCEQLNYSAWTRRKNFPGEGLAAYSGTIYSETGGLGKLGLPSRSPFFVLLVCFFNLTSAAVCLPILIAPFQQSPTHTHCVGGCPAVPSTSPLEACVGPRAASAGRTAAPVEHLSCLSFQIVYSRLFILLFWNKIYFMA